MTPEQQAEAAKRREAEMNAPRPIAALDSVWTEELTWMEVRDAIKGGKTTGLILTGGVESNGPHLATGKHNYVLKVMGEAIARKLGNALVAPILTLEPGRPDGDRVAPGSVVLSAATYRAVLTDMATSLKGMGFTNVILMGDSGGNQTAMKEVAAALDEKYKGSGTRFYFIPEYYDYSSVQKLIKEQRHSRADRDRRQPGLGSHPRGVRHRRADGALRSEDDSHRRAHQSQSRDHQRREPAADEQDAGDGEEDCRPADEDHRRRDQQGDEQVRHDACSSTSCLEKRHQRSLLGGDSRDSGSDPPAICRSSWPAAARPSS